MKVLYAILTVLGIGLMGFMCRKISNDITVPVSALEEHAQQLAKGDLRVEDIPVRTSDEIGNLTGAFNTMSHNLRELIKQITQQLFSSTRITAYRPDTLEYYYSFGSHKRIPVRFNGHIGASGQLRVSALSLRPDSVSVYALPSVLDTITAAYTLPVSINALGRDTTFSVPLRRIRGAKYSPTAVRTAVRVDQITEKTVQVPVEMVNFPATKVLRTFPTKVSITFQIGTSNYNSITADNFVIVVSYDELMNNYSGKFTPRLKTVPAGVSHVRINPREVEFIIEDIPSDN